MNDNLTFASVVNSEDFEMHFHMPLYARAYNPFSELQEVVNNNYNPQVQDIWIYQGKSSCFSSMAIYNWMKQNIEAHIVSKWLWKSSNKLRHKFLFGFLLMIGSIQEYFEKEDCVSRLL